VSAYPLDRNIVTTGPTSLADFIIAIPLRNVFESRIRTSPVEIEIHSLYGLQVHFPILWTSHALDHEVLFVINMPTSSGKNTTRRRHNTYSSTESLWRQKNPGKSATPGNSAVLLTQLGSTADAEGNHLSRSRWRCVACIRSKPRSALWKARP
jgi:hypothetical protein